MALDLQLDGREFDSRPPQLVLGCAGTQPQCFTKPSRPTQPLILSGMGNKYWPKCGYALQLGVKADMAHFTVDKRVGGRLDCVILH